MIAGQGTETNRKHTEALIKQSRELRKQAEKLIKRSEDLQRQIEQNKVNQSTQSEQGRH